MSIRRTRSRTASLVNSSNNMLPRSVESHLVRQMSFDLDSQDTDASLSLGKNRRRKRTLRRRKENNSESQTSSAEDSEEVVQLTLAQSNAEREKKKTTEKRTRKAKKSFSFLSPVNVINEKIISKKAFHSREVDKSSGGNKVPKKNQIELEKQASPKTTDVTFNKYENISENTNQVVERCEVTSTPSVPIREKRASARQLKMHVRNITPANIQPNENITPWLNVEREKDIQSSSRNSFELENTTNDIELLKRDSNTFTKPPESIVNRRSTFDLKDIVNNLNVLKHDSPFLLLEQSDVQSSPSLDDPPLQRKLTKITKKKRSKDVKKSVLRNLDLLINDAAENSTASEDAENLNTGWTASVITGTNQTDETKLITSAPKKRSMSMEDSIIVISDTSTSESASPVLQGPYTPPRSASASVRQKKRINLLKQSLLNKWNTDQCNQSPVKKFVATEMPDFNRIHKKTFDSMEDLVTMTKRKEERAKILLSGKKPLQVANNISTAPQTNKKSHTPAASARKVHFSQASASPPACETPKHSAVKERVKTPQPKAEDVLKRRTKEGYTRYGFKKPVVKEALDKENQKKAVATKSNVVKNNVTQRREVLKGVRTNRRFDLLMAMRNK